MVSLQRNPSSPGVCTRVCVWEGESPNTLSLVMGPLRELEMGPYSGGDSVFGCLTHLSNLTGERASGEGTLGLTGTCPLGQGRGTAPMNQPWATQMNKLTSGCLGGKQGSEEGSWRHRWIPRSGKGGSGETGGRGSQDRAQATARELPMSGSELAAVSGGRGVCKDPSKNPM